LVGTVRFLCLWGLTDLWCLDGTVGFDCLCGLTDHWCLVGIDVFFLSLGSYGSLVFDWKLDFICLWGLTDR